MTATLVAGPGYAQKWVEYVAPVAQTSANADTVLTGSGLDARGWLTVCYTILIATNTVDWTVYGANLSTYADEVVVQAEASVVAGAASSYAVTPAPYGYYRVKIHSNAGGAHGTATLVGIAK